jgi:hypothetical protein
MAAKTAKKKVAKKAVNIVKRVYTKRKKDEPVTTFEIADGLPITRRMHISEELYRKLANTIEALEVGKKHALMPKEHRAQVLKVAKNDYAKFVIRTSLNPDKKTISVWRER